MSNNLILGTDYILDENGYALLTGNLFPKGYRIQIRTDEDFNHQTDFYHSSGGKFIGATEEFSCPLCDMQVFPVFRLDFKDQRLKDLSIWNLPYMQIPVCPRCYFGFKPYYTVFNSNGIDRIHTEGTSNRNILALKELVHIELPYGNRVIELTELTKEDYPLTLEDVIDFIDCARPPHVYHQICGWPPTGILKKMICIKCKIDMQFGGIVDTDRNNIPIFRDGHEQGGLLIADCKKLYFFTCKDCNIIGVQTVY